MSMEGGAAGAGRRKNKMGLHLFSLRIHLFTPRAREGGVKMKELPKAEWWGFYRALQGWSFRIWVRGGVDTR